MNNIGKKIVTHMGNILFCVEINGKEFYGAMTSLGHRFAFKHELVRGKYLDHREWDNALEKWNGPNGGRAQAETMTPDELALANLLAHNMAKDFTYDMTNAQKHKLRHKHVLSFQ